MYPNYYAFPYVAPSSSSSPPPPLLKRVHTLCEISEISEEILKRDKEYHQNTRENYIVYT